MGYPEIRVSIHMQQCLFILLNTLLYHKPHLITLKYTIIEVFDSGSRQITRGPFSLVQTQIFSDSASFWQIATPGLVIRRILLSGIQMTFEYQTLWCATYFWLFEYRTSSVFRSPLYVYLLCHWLVSSVPDLCLKGLHLRDWNQIQNWNSRCHFHYPGQD